MAVGSGVGSAFGVAKETTYGTRVAPTRFFRAKSYKANRTAERPQGAGIQGGSFGDIGAHYVETVNGAEVTADIDVTLKDFGILLENLMGTTVTPTQQAATTAYLQTHTLADNYGKALTVQVQAPYRTGSVIAQEVTGAKIQQADFSCDMKGILGCSLTMDGQAFTDSQTAASVSYTASGSNGVFHGGWMNLKTGTYNSETAVSGVRAVTCSIQRPMDDEDYTAGSSGLKAQPVLNDTTKITGTVTADWLAKATFQTLVTGNTSTSLVWEFVGPTAIASTYYPAFRITLPSVYFTGDMQGVDGRNELTNTWNYEWKYDGTNLPVITYMSTDTAV